MTIRPSATSSPIWDHAYIVATIVLAVYSQLVMRWQVGLAGGTPADLVGKIGFVLRLMLNPWVISSVLSTLLSGVAWMLVMTRFEISYAYPFVSLGYVIVMLAGVALFGESLNGAKVVGTLLVVAGIVMIARQ